MNNIKYYYSLLFILFSLLLTAQPSSEDQPFIPVNPEAASLGKFIEAPVNNCTGVPAINIPIHTLQEGPLSVPVSLMYHASGIRVEEVASWVGTGWTLNAGGMISRTILGLRDDEAPGGYLFVADSVSLTNDQFKSDLHHGLVDSEPDVFSFSFPGYSGKFFFDRDGEPVLVPKQPLKVEYNSPSNLTRFTITTPDGTKYIFGNAVSIGGGFLTGIERGGLEDPISAQPVYQVNGWRLVEIISQDEKHFISFSYELENYSYKMRPYREVLKGNGYRGYVEQATGGQFQQLYVEGRRLKSIEGQYSKLNFIAGSSRDDLTTDSLNGPKSLGAIQFESGSFDMNWQFSYDYFTDPDSEGPEGKRLRLVQFQQQSLKPYQFDYYTRDGEYFLPNRLSRQQDYWGYYNGKEENNSSIYMIPNVLPIDGWACEGCTANRNSDEEMMKLGTINKIVYPTGGATYFEFEGNRYIPTDSSPERPPLGDITIVQFGPTITNCTAAIVPDLCCGILTEQTTLSLTEDEIWNGFVRMTMIKSLDGTDNCGTPVDVRMMLNVYDSSNPGIAIYQGGFDLHEELADAAEEGNTTDDLEDQMQVPFSQIGDLVPDHDYIFEIKVEDAFGRLELFKNAIVYEEEEDGYIVGGLRAHQIRISESASDTLIPEDIIKTYEYSPGILLEEYPLFGIPVKGPFIKGFTSDLLLDYIEHLDPVSYDPETDSIIIEGSYDPFQDGPITFAAGSVPFSGALFMETPFVPLMDISGYHIAYETVTERQPENGYTELKFDIEVGINVPPPVGQPLETFPGTGPQLIRVEHGNLLETKIHSQEGELISHSESTPYTESYEWTSGTVFKHRTLQYYLEPFLQGGYNCGCIRPALNYIKQFFLPYANRTKYYRISQRTESLDGVTKTTNYGYDQSGNHPFPVEQSFENSNGEEHTTKIYYAHEVGDTVMINKHMIGIPLITENYVDDTQVGGSKTTYEDATGFPGVLVPKEVSNWEGQAWDLVGTFTGHQFQGYPTVFDKNYYDHDMLYEWDEKRLVKKTYSGFEWEWDYYFDSHRLLKKATGPDDTYSRFYYDDILRLSTQKFYGNNDSLKYSISYDYHYANSGEDQNYIRTTTIYNDETPSKESIQYFDGLGRPYQTEMVGYGPQGENVVVEEIYYEDKINRIERKTHLVGNLETYEYEPSPLNRIIMTTFPDGHSVDQEYGNSGNYYKSIIRDEKDNETETLTDIIGRTASVKNALGGTTTFEYDIYSNPTKITTPQGSEYLYTYDYAQDHLHTTSIPGGGTIICDYYDDKDLLKSQEDGNGIKISMKYDEYDRVTNTYLGDIGGEDWIINSYFTSNGPDGPITQLQSVKNKILETENGPTGYTFDHYKYDEFSRIKEYTFDHHLGADTTFYHIDYGDRTTITTLGHHAISDHQVVLTNTYDTYDRLMTSHHNIVGVINSMLTDNTYTVRDQINTKTVGGAVDLKYFYHPERGWLTGINKPYQGYIMLPNCELTETGEEDPNDSESIKVFVDHLTLEELLSARFNLNLNFQGSEGDPCPVIDCTPPGDSCSTNDIQASLDVIHNQFVNQVSTAVEILCADSTIETQNVIQLDQLVFPTTLYRVRFCDMSERYLTPSLLSLIQGGYEIVQEVNITAAGQVFEVQMNGTTYVYKLEELLTELIAGTDIIIEDYVPCGQPDCDPFVSCTEEEVNAQNAALAFLEENTPLVVPDPEAYPVTIYELELCNGQQFYVLEGEMSYFVETSILVTDTIIVSSVNDSIPMTSEPSVKNDIYGSDGIFHMLFRHEPNGNIDTMQWQVANRTKMEYACTYDDINRLTKTVFTEFDTEGLRTTGNQYGVPAIGYDADGNIEGITRRGLKGLCENNKYIYGRIDLMAYNYDGLPNQVTSIDELSNKIRGYKQLSGGSYSYDNEGNMTYNGAKGLTIDYNELNLPKKIEGAEGTIEFTYDASGRKLQKLVTGENQYTLNYISGFEYRNSQLESVYHSEGRVYFSGIESLTPTSAPRYEFALRDHLGNSRLLFSDLNGDGGIRVSVNPEVNEIIQEHHYYPFGMAFEGPWTMHPQKEMAYQYNGKEMNDDLELEWLDYGARWYDPAIGRFTGVDPVSDQFPHVSTYNYAENEPIRHIDLWGLQKYDPQTGQTGPWSDEYLQSQGESSNTILGSLSDASTVGTAIDALLSSTVILSSMTKEAVKSPPGTRFFELERYFNPTQYMGGDLKPKLNFNGVVTYQNLAEFENAGFKDVTAEYTSKATKLKILRNGSTGLTYLGIAADFILLADEFSRKEIDSATKMNKSILFTLKSSAAYASTAHPLGAVAYFTFLGVEYGAVQQSKMIKEQGGIYRNQFFPYQIVPGLGPTLQSPSNDSGYDVQINDN